MLSPRDLVSRPDNMDETVLSSSAPLPFAYATAWKRKHALCIWEDICSNHTAHQHLCLIDSTIPLLLNPKFQASDHLLWLYSLVCVGPGQKPEDRFFPDEAHIIRQVFS